MHDQTVARNNRTLEWRRTRPPAILRPPMHVFLFLLKSFLAMVNRHQRQALIRIPGVLSAYSLISRMGLLARSENGIPSARVNGLKMYLDPAEQASVAACFLWDQFEVATTAVVMEVLSGGDTVVDIGAHWGYFALLASSLCGARGRVFAFEPHPKNFALLTSNIEANHLSNVVAIRKAVSDRGGSSRLVQAWFSAGHSLLHVPPELGRKRGSTDEAVSVDTVTLDDFFAQNSAGVRLIKMDIEGAEPLALAGMHRLIERSPALVLISELNASFLDARAAADFLGRLDSWGFELAIIDDNRRQIALGSKAAILKKRFEKKSANNLLATRDCSLFERLFQQQGRPGTRLSEVEVVRL